MFGRLVGRITSALTGRLVGTAYDATPAESSNVINGTDNVINGTDNVVN